MSVLHCVQIVCDNPGCFVAFQGDYTDLRGAALQRHKAKQQGWAVARPGGLDFCPDHHRLKAAVDRSGT